MFEIRRLIFEAKNKKIYSMLTHILILWSVLANHIRSDEQEIDYHKLYKMNILINICFTSPDNNRVFFV